MEPIKLLREDCVMTFKDTGIYDLVNIFTGKPTEAHQLSQGGVINNEERYINIPAYQRPYRWTTDSIKRLFEDYDENRAEYFLGSAVIVSKCKENGSIEFDVVDGQQRLTTLYLLNYIRYLLRREYTMWQLSKSYQPKASEYCLQLKANYVNMVGKNNRPFDAILLKIDKLMEDETLDQNERVDQLIDCYKRELCIADLKETSEETRDERIRLAHSFFDSEEKLCLKYSRPRYDTVLKNAMCNVYLKNITDTSSYELGYNKNANDDDPFIENYIDAMRCIFEEIWNRAKNQDSEERNALMNCCERALKYADEIIKNMSLCVVLTENENDANKLFEVLNDRALDVEDLELIKNHFYKEYCTKSSDNDEERDKRITELDELWTDKIFNGNGVFKTRLISYLSAVYFTCDKELVYKDNLKYKNAIDQKYTSKCYSSSAEKNKRYEYTDILADFNTYFAVKILLDKVGFKSQKANELSLNAEQENKSITYKTFHLLNALKYHAVIPALTNVIIAAYASKHKLSDEGFEATFTKYVEDLINDNKHKNSDYQKIHQCAYMLWIASLKGKDHEDARNIAKRIIEKYGRVGFPDEDLDFSGKEIKNLNEKLKDWLDNWSYSSNKTFAVKVILLHLLQSERTNGSYDSDKAEIKENSGLIYSQNAAKLQLDHLEANSIQSKYAAEKYYLYNDIEKRQKDVNGYLGNFMILDADDNNQKNNYPLYYAIDYYSKIDKSWLVADIKKMMIDKKYFDLDLKIPREEFFKERTKRLKKYIICLLDKGLADDTIEVIF